MERKYMNNIFETVKKKYDVFLVLIIILIIWQFVTEIFKIPEFVLPSPLAAFKALFIYQANQSYNWRLQILTTTYEVFISFAITSFVGITLAIIISWTKWLNNVIMPLFIFVNSLPIIAIAPIILLWFGYGIFTNILIAFLVSFFPIVINSATGFYEVDDDLIGLVRYLNASKWQIFIKIRFPNALPYIFSGLKISSTMCVVGAIVGEFIASDKGLGYIIINSLYTMDTAPIFASLFVVAFIGITLFGIVSFIEKRSIPWYEFDKFQL
ncbi:MAG: ABC transporter permease [Spirochaetales bacterium]|nr:ABC transporter permease [Spirochaetales bacterium]